MSEKDNFFTPVANTKPFFKMGIQGFAGSGKTYSAAQIAIGLHGEIKSDKPVIIFDTEKSAKFLKEPFAEAGIELLVREARSLADLVETMKRCEAGAADILIIDSLSHVWESYIEAYKQDKKKSRLEMLDWGIIKPMWKRMFSDPFVSSSTHIIFTGRAGYEYENEKNEETGKREIYKSGVKMKVEGETAYEPDMLVYMERFEEILHDDKKVWRQGTVLKDRSTRVDGKVFKDPTYENFAPAVRAMISGGTENTASPEVEMEFEFKSEEEKYEMRRQREKYVERSMNLLNRLFPSAVGKDRANKLELLEIAFGTDSESEINNMFPDALASGYNKLVDTVVEMGFAHFGQRAGRTVMIVGPAPDAVTQETVAAPGPAVAVGSRRASKKQEE